MSPPDCDRPEMRISPSTNVVSIHAKLPAPDAFISMFRAILDGESGARRT